MSKLALQLAIAIGALVLGPVAIAQSYSAHSTSVAATKPNDGQPHILSDFRDVRLWSEDMNRFILSMPGCDFDIAESSLAEIAPELDTQLEQMFRRTLDEIGWHGPISFTGDLINARRTDITATPIPELICESERVQHRMAISPAPLGNDLFKRIMILNYQIDISTKDVTLFVVTAREDVLTDENYRAAIDAADFLGELARALLGAR